MAFGLVIAVMKDVPDIAGDRAHQVRSFSVRFGPRRCFRGAVAALVSLLGVTGGVCLVAAAKAAGLGGGRGGGLGGGRAVGRAVVGAIAWAAAVRVGRKGRQVEAREGEEVYGYYMFLWQLFYLAYLLLPLAR
jgi:homogentisate phytyltransferase/homogentisate geranylgeranyltransferase